MWSDPPDTPEGLFCFFNCTDYALEVLGRLLDDPANDDRPYGELTGQANRAANQAIIMPAFTEAAIAAGRVSGADDPGFISCEPWGYAKQIFSPHQNEITINSDHIVMHYGEWDAYRTIYTDGRTAPENLEPSLMGFATGRFEVDTLIVNTSHVAAGLLANFHHSNQLTAEEHYTLSADGQILTLYATFQDPWALKTPLTFKKIWKWSPTEEIYPYDECVIPTDFIESRGAAR
ncbi:MAG: hypothetical protein O2971_20220 [Proteobacteria bacterium]|nr:hypothetical protein [Pseudomonadota bacterium]